MANMIFDNPIGFYVFTNNTNPYYTNKYVHFIKLYLIVTFSFLLQVSHYNYYILESFPLRKFNYTFITRISLYTNLNFSSNQTFFYKLKVVQYFYAAQSKRQNIFQTNYTVFTKMSLTSMYNTCPFRSCARKKKKTWTMWLTWRSPALHK